MGATETNAPLPARRVGRPTDYRPEYCDQVVEAMAQGYSLTAFAGLILVARNTVYEWMKAHSEFRDAVTRAAPARQYWWERRLRQAEKGGEVAAAIFALRNIAPDDWKEVRNVHVRHTVANTLTDAELYAIASGNSAGGAVIDGEATHVNER